MSCGLLNLLSALSFQLSLLSALSPSHLLIFSSSYLLIFSPSYLLIFSPSQPPSLLAFKPCALSLELRFVCCELWVMGCCRAFGRRPMEDGRPLRLSSLFHRPSSLVLHLSSFHPSSLVLRLLSFRLYPFALRLYPFT